jgi:hypothetical protein
MFLINDIFLFKMFLYYNDKIVCFVQDNIFVRTTVIKTIDNVLENINISDWY